MKIGDLRLAVFESSLRTNFLPLSLTRPTFDLNLGTGTLLARIEARVGRNAQNLYVPSYLCATTAEVHPDVEVNAEISDKCLLVNSLVADRPEVWHAVDQALAENEEALYYDSTGDLVFGIQEQMVPVQIQHGFNKSVNKKSMGQDLDGSSLIRYLWTLVELNASAITSDFAGKYLDRQRAEGDFEARGSKFSISRMSDIERYVTLDSRNGPIIVEDGAQIQSFSHLTGPCFVGKNAVVKSAKIREGTSIDEYSRISGEVEQSIISSYTNKNHDGFVGHSVVGSWVNLGALTTTSDLKNTYGEIKVNLHGKRVSTGKNKLGAFVGDMAKTSIGTLINSGISIGASSFALGNVTEDVPSYTIFSGFKRNNGMEVYIESAIETQRRMMSRRGIKISDAYISMMKEAFKLTRRERSLRKVTRGKFTN